ncbi:DgyrCDS14678 [Dimorphilus gyrociliatus]|uniref:DgyrCDS14678 n=1 Tax=Dimorphilus gyrociliatus TaxID=2664684 RepID=A0A7I8WEV7_9ANNE|nr:DgyrCDS14678 [Dimorphilus gyrociliatus]
MDSVSFDLKSLLLNYHKKIDLSIKAEISSMESSSRKVDMINLRSQLNCNYTLPNPDKASKDKLEKIFSMYSDDTVVVTKLGSAKSALMKLTCATVDSFVFSIDIPIYFTPNSDPWSSASGDPHFQQIVVDYPALTTKSICYDVTGSPEEYLYIAGFTLSGMQVYGQLNDDYYMHRIIIKFDSGRITALTDYLILDNGQIINWTDDMQKITFKSKRFEYYITRNLIFINSFENPGKIIQIQKSIHSLSEIHLDVSFKLSPKDYKKMDGLIGDIGKKKYIFHSEVQSDRNVGSKSISIEIDNKLIKGEKVERNKEECWLIDVDDILKPFEISKYLYKTMNVFENVLPNQ